MQDQNSPDIYHHVFIQNNPIEKTQKGENNELSHIATRIGKDLQSRKLIFSFQKTDRVRGMEENPKEIDMRDTPLWEMVQVFRRSALRNTIKEAKDSINTSATLADEYGTEIDPRSLRTEVALRREYFQILTLPPVGEPHFIPGGIQTGAVGEAKIPLKKKGLYDAVVNIHNHPESAVPSMVDIEALSKGVDAEIITLPDDRVFLITSNQSRTDGSVADPKDIDWLTGDNVQDKMSELYTCLSTHGCFVEKFGDDNGEINSFGKTILYSLYSFAAARRLGLSVYGGSYTGGGLFNLADIPSDILPELKERVFGKDTDEVKLFEDIKKITIPKEKTAK